VFEVVKDFKSLPEKKNILIASDQSNIYAAIAMPFLRIKEYYKKMPLPHFPIRDYCALLKEHRKDVSYPH
jgi:hypothetical protein